MVDEPRDKAAEKSLSDETRLGLTLAAIEKAVAGRPVNMVEAACVVMLARIIAAKNPHDEEKRRAQVQNMNHAFEKALAFEHERLLELIKQANSPVVQPPPSVPTKH